MIDKTIAGVALDVFEKEPPEDSQLFKQDNVILTPYVGYYSEKSQVELQTKAAGIRDALLGRRPKYLVNKEVWS